MRYAMIITCDQELGTIGFVCMYITALALAIGNHERLMSHTGERDEDENSQRGVICGSRHPLGRSVFRSSSKEETRDQDSKDVLSRSE
jgi:hypothetical protein